MATSTPNPTDSDKPQSNAERLAAQLAANGLARALLAVWNPAEPPERRRERLQQTLISHNPGQASNDAAATDTN